MPRTYETQSAKLIRLIQDDIIPAIQNNKDLDYKKVVNHLSAMTGLQISRVESVLGTFIARGDIKEQRILTIPDEALEGWLKNYVETKKEEERQKEAELSPEQFEEKLGEIVSREIAPDTPPKKQTEPVGGGTNE